MSRDKGRRPYFYDAGIKFSLRCQPEGGGLAKKVNVEVLMSDSLVENEIYVLIHGFNNHQGEAEFAYQGFRDRQTEQLQPQRYWRLTKQLRDTFWPGDAEWTQPLDCIDFMVYPKAVGVARNAGKKLAAFLVGLDAPKIVNFIGHSLGCRLILETVLGIQKLDQAELVGKICLMAAAVPVFMLTEGERLDKAGFVPDEILNLTSKSDRVLHYAFPAGQTAAGPSSEGFFPGALGRHGMIHARIRNRIIYKANHGDYWGHIGRDGSNERRRSILANKYVAELFGWKRLKKRTIDSRQVAYEQESRNFETKLKKDRLPGYSRRIRSRTLS